jgi:hypothetical protein
MRPESSGASGSRSLDARSEQALYASSIQAIFAYFERFLNGCNAEGIVVGDFRTPALNSKISHSIFTQKYKQAGDEFPRILETPTFGHSVNHVGIQVADLVASALLFPMATVAYCLGHVTNVHVDPDFRLLTKRFGPRLRALQYRYWDANEARSRDGITVDDRIRYCSGAKLFRP